MKVFVAKGAGFCYGVKRAMDMAYAFADKNKGKKLYSLREIIHNPQEVKKLESRGVETVEEIGEIKGDAAAIISTHGVTPAEEAALKAKNVEEMDTTCPYVKKIHLIVKRLKEEGYGIIIVGDRDHYEVRGILGYAGQGAAVVSDIKEVKKLNVRARMGIVAQTTLNEAVFSEISCALMQRVFTFRNSEARIFNTICDATHKRQEATVALAKRADVVVIVGGKNSANTRRLTELAKGILKDVHHIESEEELKAAWFKGKKSAGVSAGASTPEWLIKKVVSKIKSYGRK